MVNIIRQDILWCGSQFCRAFVRLEVSCNKLLVIIFNNNQQFSDFRKGTWGITLLLKELVNGFIINISRDNRKNYRLK